MGPTKAVMKGSNLHEAVSGKLIKEGLTSHKDIKDYVDHHYLVLPVVDKKCRPWLLDGKQIFCLHGTQYETLDGTRVHLARCPDCGGMGIRADELTVQSDVIRCTSCGHEFDARLEMMET
jgi:predicted RNA-binding Zn-ribbon protein involved in translation (DUF1610 family)